MSTDRAGPRPAPDTFLSGDAGAVLGPRRRLGRTVGDLALSALEQLSLTGPRLERLLAAQEPRRVLVLSVYRPASRLPAAVRDLRSERHDVTLALGATASADPVLADVTVARGLTGGKFQNLNRVLREGPSVDGFDWTLVVDDDVRLPPRFLDKLVALCERFRLDCAQPAQTLRSHAAWRVTRRRPLALARRTRFVEIGPVTAFSGRVAAALLPFPELRFGWGLDLHWSALAEERGWRLGVLDGLPVRHEDAPVATAYRHAEAIAEAGRFLAARAYLGSAAAQETLVTHRRLGPVPGRPDGAQPGRRAEPA